MARLMIINAFKQLAKLFLKVTKHMFSLLELHLRGLIFPDVEGKLKINSTVLYLLQKHFLVDFQHFSIKLSNLN